MDKIEPIYDYQTILVKESPSGLAYEIDKTIKKYSVLGWRVVSIIPHIDIKSAIPIKGTIEERGYQKNTYDLNGSIKLNESQVIIIFEKKSLETKMAESKLEQPMDNNQTINKTDDNLDKPLQQKEIEEWENAFKSIHPSGESKILAFIAYYQHEGVTLDNISNYFNNYPKTDLYYFIQRLISSKILISDNGRYTISEVEYVHAERIKNTNKNSVIN